MRIIWIRRMVCTQSIVTCHHPCEEFELTANSLGAHTETHGGLILRTFISLAVNSQHELTHEIVVSIP